MLFPQVHLLLVGLLACVAIAAPHNPVNSDIRTAIIEHSPDVDSNANYLPDTADDVKDDINHHLNRAEFQTNTAPTGFVKRAVAKRGIAFSSAGVVPQFQSSKVSWAHNWATNPAGTCPGVEYVPMLWGAKMFSYWNADANSALAAGSKHLIGFNEPDILEQANMSPQDAAAAFKQYITPFNGRAQLGSPGCSNSETPGMGLSWMRDFFIACAGQCGIDFMTTHWYAPADQVEYFKQHVNEAIATAKSFNIHSIWITEFGALGSDAAQQAFLDQIIPWLDSKAEVQRYAYFYAAPGHLMSGNAINALGRQYINA